MLRPYRVEWAPAAVEAVRDRVRAYRFPRAPEGAGWRYGCDPDYLAALCAYWADGFDAGAPRRR